MFFSFELRSKPAKDGEDLEAEDDGGSVMFVSVITGDNHIIDAQTDGHSHDLH